MAGRFQGTGKSGSCLTNRHEGSGKDLECDYGPCTCNCHARNAGQGEPIHKTDTTDDTDPQGDQA